MIKNFLAATVFTLAALPLSAQQTNDDYYNILSTQLCFSEINGLDRFLEMAGQKKLFTGLGITVVLSEQFEEMDELTFTIVYANQDTSDFSIIGVYDGGLACILTEGTGFEPYVD